MIYLAHASTSEVFKSILVFVIMLKSGLCEIEYNTVNPDGSFSYRHTNDDIGSYYHSVAGNPDNSIRGRYGSRSPSSGRVEETVYTAGPRGFRVNGPQIHRKMDLSQIRRRRIGSADDPLADPYDDPTYSFSFKTPDYNRNEDADSDGRIRGLYSYFDDIGEKHTVRYAAGAGTGFEVLNSVPDSQSTIAYRAPLYKATPKARGKVSIQRGPNGLYKFIATGPDQRRSEVSGPDGIVRGSYSYLDDKGVQRTVEYEAGAGIGYRIVQNSVGRGSHLNTNIPNLRSSDSIPPKEYLQTSNSGRIRPKDTDTGTDRRSNSRNEAKKDSKVNRNQIETTYSDESYSQNSSRGGIKFKAGSKRPTAVHDDKFLDEDNESDNDNDSNSYVNSNKVGTNEFGQTETKRNKATELFKGASLSFNDDLSSIPPVITSNRRILEIGREQDWNSRNRDSTIIKNVGKWYIGLPPGQSVRAHVQNIDILPIGGRNISPSEALRRDELSDIKRI